MTETEARDHATAYLRVAARFCEDGNLFAADAARAAALDALRAHGVEGLRDAGRLGEIRLDALDLADEGAAEVLRSVRA